MVLRFHLPYSHSVRILYQWIWDPLQRTGLQHYTFDDIRPVAPDKPLPDLVYVDKPISTANLAAILKELPYHGPGWYSKIATEYCLHTHKLSWEDLRYMASLLPGMCRAMR